MKSQVDKLDIGKLANLSRPSDEVKNKVIKRPEIGWKN